MFSSGLTVAKDKIIRSAVCCSTDVSMSGRDFATMRWIQFPIFPYEEQKKHIHQTRMLLRKGKYCMSKTTIIYNLPFLQLTLAVYFSVSTGTTTADFLTASAIASNVEEPKV